MVRAIPGTCVQAGLWDGPGRVDGERGAAFWPVFTRSPARVPASQTVHLQGLLRSSDPQLSPPWGGGPLCSLSCGLRTCRLCYDTEECVCFVGRKPSRVAQPVSGLFLFRVAPVVRVGTTSSERLPLSASCILAGPSPSRPPGVGGRGSVSGGHLSVGLSSA